MSRPSNRGPSRRPPTKVVIQGQPRTLRGVDRTLARVDRLLGRVIPFDEWVRRTNPSERDITYYHSVANGLRRERDRLLELRAKLASAEPEGT